MGAVAAYMKKKADAIGEQLDYDSVELYVDELDELLDEVVEAVEEEPTEEAPEELPEEGTEAL